jgi:TPR repeat protein
VTVLGVCYSNGWGVIQDSITAFNWNKKAAEWGVPNAQFNLAQSYNNGKGVAQDHHAAFNWYKKAAEWDGDLMIVEAQFAMGYNYATGEGVTQDYIRAYMWWDIATKNGDKRAVSNLNILKKGISLSEASSAKFLVRECVKKKYKDC